MGMFERDLAYYFFPTFGRTVTYTPRIGAPKQITAIIEYSDGASSEGADMLGVEATMDIQAADISEVTYGATVTIGTETWDVIRGGKVADGLVWRLVINKRR